MFRTSAAHLLALWFQLRIDFSSGTPVAISTPLSTDEGCASISDTNGQLLFYSNGETVWDRNNNVMPNGSGAIQQLQFQPERNRRTFPDASAALLPLHRSATGRRTIGQPNAAYSIRDMAANGGNGDVVMANGARWSRY
ncbi:MAG: hypothetical protein IPH05_17535 [Flavobacteriales bacterium]|nr:hypothetical protein [Flavobacteriales bacterium]